MAEQAHHEVAGLQVDGDHRLDFGAPGPRHEPVQTECVGLDRPPGQVQPLGPVGHRTDTVLPPVTGYEVAAGVADHRHAQLPYQLQHVQAEALGVRLIVVGIVDPAVDAAPHVLDERAEQARVHRSDPECGVERHVAGEHSDVSNLYFSPVVATP
jgi:hypothetical protein